jgi:hypothetical protein
MLRPDVDSIDFDLISGGREPFRFRIRTDCKWLNFSALEGEVSETKRIRLSVNKAVLEDKVTGTFDVENIGYGTVCVTVEASPGGAVSGLFMESDGYICMEADHFSDKKDVPGGAFTVLSPYGRSGSAIKVFPSTADFTDKTRRPSVSYRFVASKDSEYELTFELAPTTPVTFKPTQCIGFSMNRGRIQILDTVRQPDRPFFGSRQWAVEAMESVKKVTTKVKCSKGENTLTFYGMSPSVVLERILLVKEGVELPESYLGPGESYRGL